MKKYCAAFLTFVLILTLMPGIPVVAASYTYGDLTYVEVNGKVSITDCASTVEGSVTIPATLGSHPVDRIANGAFMGCTGLTEIIIPEGVRFIEPSAFYLCSNLTSASLPKSLISIGEGAFFGTDLRSVYISENVRSIDTYAFAYNENLESVHIDSISAWCNIRFGMLPSVLTEEATLYLNGSPIEDLVIPSDVTHISDYAFFCATGIRTLTIPEGVESIGSNAFANCTGLTEISLPQSLTSIGSSAFLSCDLLEEVRLPDQIKEINDYTFFLCSALKTVYLPKALEEFHQFPFDMCGPLSFYYPGTAEEWKKIRGDLGHIDFPITVYCND